MANLSNINNKLIVTDGGNLLVNATANLATYGGITIDNFSDPSIAMKTTGTSGWLWTQYITSTGTNNFSMGVNQTVPYWCVKAGAGMDSPHLVVNSSGNVGIGDTTPSFPLVISKSSSSTSNGADLSMRLALSNPDQTNNNYALITFGDGTSDPGSGFMGMQFTDHTNNYGELVFGTRGGGGYSERMRIDSSGNLLLNQATSRIKGGGSTTGRLELSNSDSKSYMMITGSTRTSDPNLIYFVNDAAVTLTLNANNSATFAGKIVPNANIELPYGGELRTLDSNGGVRTIVRASSNKLQYGWSYAGAVEFMGGGSYTPRITINTDGSTTFAGKITAPTLSIQNQINTTSSNLEINYANGDGTTTNFKDFYVRDGKNAVILNIQGSSKSATFAGNIYLPQSAGTIQGNGYPYTTYLGSGANATTTYLQAGSTVLTEIKLLGGDVGRTITFTTGNSERMRITSGGKTLIGITSEQNAGHLQMESGTSENGGILDIAGGGWYRYYTRVCRNSTSVSTAGYWHIKTNIVVNTNVMFMAKFYGYIYGSAQVLDLTHAGYAYSGSNTVINQGATNNGSDPNASSAIYASSNGNKVTFRIAFGTGSNFSTYFAGVMMDMAFPSPAGQGHDFEIEAQTFSPNTTVY